MRSKKGNISYHIKIKTVAVSEESPLRQRSETSPYATVLSSHHRWSREDGGGLVRDRSEGMAVSALVRASMLMVQAGHGVELDGRDGEKPAFSS